MAGREVPLPTVGEEFFNWLEGYRRGRKGRGLKLQWLPHCPSSLGPTK